ncbi:MAG: thiamine diphosphokinase, partial [Candidatus Flemingiibacterium sp.]
MTAYIFTGGQVFADSLAELVTEIPEGSLVIAADSGYNNAKKLGAKPDMLLGDLDSLDRTGLGAHELDELEKLIVPSIKDDTDTQLAVDTALERGAESIVLIGGLGGRLDHTLSTVFLLEYIADKGAGALVTDGRNRARLMKSTGGRQTLRVERGYKYLSLVSLTDTCEGVTVSGVFYPLWDARLMRSYSYAVSNEITADF